MHEGENVEQEQWVQGACMMRPQSWGGWAMPRNCNATEAEADWPGEGAEGAGRPAPGRLSIVNAYFLQLLKRSVLPGS